ncbi:MAG: hypothetical protein QOE28_2265 [Solirubrobacteraceae bacterium]|nr:hypothetical protein [Solirubrobacteraceae bacterium]
MKARYLTIAAAGLALVPASAGVAAGTPHLSMRSSQPVVISGSGFRSGESLSVRVSVGGATRTHRLRASASGTFRTRYAQLSASDGCSSRLRATARHGSTLRASFLQPRRDCAPRY